MSGQRYDSVLLFGPPGVGKGTQGQMIGRTTGIFHLSSGGIFRALDQNSETGREIRQFTARGDLVPDELTIQIWKAWLDEQVAQARFLPQKQLLLLDGIPRNIHQCEMLEDHIQVVKLIHLICPDEQTMIERITQRAISEGRADDTDESVIRHRFEVYRDKTAPVINFYPVEVIAEIDPLGTPSEVFKRIQECLVSVRKSGSAKGAV